MCPIIADGLHSLAELLQLPFGGATRAVKHGNTCIFLKSRSQSKSQSGSLTESSATILTSSLEVSWSWTKIEVNNSYHCSAQVFKNTEHRSKNTEEWLTPWTLILIGRVKQWPGGNRLFLEVCC